jgi:hypothetical protein
MRVNDSMNLRQHAERIEQVPLQIVPETRRHLLPSLDPRCRAWRFTTALLARKASIAEARTNIMQRPPNYGPLRIAAIGDIFIARHAGMNDAAHATTTTIPVE